MCISVYTNNVQIELNLFMEDTLGPTILSTVERSSTLHRYKCLLLHYRKPIFSPSESVLCREVFSIVSFI